MRYFFVLILLGGLWCLPVLLSAQESEADSLSAPINENDTLLIKTVKGPDPTRAALYSAVFPGLGQIYNKRYWMLPIIYGGAYALGYYIDFNNDQYNMFRSALFAVRAENIDPDNPLHQVSESTLENETDRWRRFRDQTIVASVAAYLFVIVEAYTNAHLKNFPKIKKLSWQLQPRLDQTPFSTPVNGLALVINF
ncbi:MAG: DUF5683 domain-containing protein [Cyclobacteriaceae bacterium]